MDTALTGIAKEEFPMIKVIMGLKGSGKTKQLINAIQDAVATEAGDIVCIAWLIPKSTASRTSTCSRA